MDTGKFWVSILTLIALVVISLMGITSHYHLSDIEYRTRMVEAGVDPIMVSCVIGDTYNKDPKCMVLATKRL